MRDEVKGGMGILDQTHLDTEIDAWINLSFRNAQTIHSFRCMQARTAATFTTVVDQRNYGTGNGIPTGMKDVLGDGAVYIDDSDVHYPLKGTSASNCRKIYDAYSDGRPRFYVWEPTDADEGMDLWPLPDDTYNVYVEHYAYLTALSLDADQHWLSINAPQIGVSGALRWGLRRTRDVKALPDVEQAFGQAIALARELDLDIVNSDQNQELVPKLGGAAAAVDGFGRHRFDWESFYESF